MITSKKLSAVLALTLACLAGCAAPSDEEETSSGTSSALEQLEVATPVITEIERPLDLSFGFEDLDWSDVQVQRPGTRNQSWKPATTAGRPLIVDRPPQGSAIVDQFRSGFGSGPCRLRLSIGRREVGVRCKWTF